MNYKSNKKIAILLCFLLLLIPISASFGAPKSDKQKELESKINDVNTEIAKLDAEIAKYEEEILKTGSEAKTLSNHIKELNLTRSKLLKQVEQINSQIKLSNKMISELTDKILSKEDQINLSRKTISKTFYDLYRSEYINPIEIMITDGGLSRLSNEYNNKILISDKLDNFIKELADIKTSLASAKKEEEEEKKKLSELNTKLNLEKQVIDQSKAEKDKLLKETKNQEAEYQRILEENKKKLEAFNNDLRTYEAQLKFILDNKLLPEKGSAVLGWPLQKFIITQFFGITASSGRLYASGSHSGVDFGVPVGTPVYAVDDGIIKGIGDTDQNCKGVSFGKWVFIEHYNGLSTTYGHLSAISAKPGQEVKKGDLIALSGNTGHSTGPHLHLTVYASQGAKVEAVPTKTAYCKGVYLVMPIAPTNAYLDPMSYLPKPAPNLIKKGI